MLGNIEATESKNVYMAYKAASPPVPLSWPSFTSSTYSAQTSLSIPASFPFCAFHLHQPLFLFFFFYSSAFLSCFWLIVFFSTLPFPCVAQQTALADAYLQKPPSPVTISHTQRDIHRLDWAGNLEYLVFASHDFISGLLAQDPPLHILPPSGVGRYRSSSVPRAALCCHSRICPPRVHGLFPFEFY